MGSLAGDSRISMTMAGRSRIKVSRAPAITPPAVQAPAATAAAASTASPADSMAAQIAAGQAAAAGRALYEHVIGSRERMHQATGVPAEGARPAARKAR